MTYTFRDVAAAQHGPSKAVYAVPTDPIADALRAGRADCPECGSPLDVQTEIDKLTPAGIVNVPRVAFCCGCEFAREF